MAKDLRFDVSALDKASQTFARMGAAVERFEKRLDRLDGKKVDVEVGVKTDQAEREVGKFATDTRRKLEAALANLPEIEIDASSTDADRKLADIRRRMQELTDKRIGVDLSAEEAIAESRALQRELEQLARTSPNVQVQVDAASAAAKLAEIDAQVGRLDGRRAEIKIDVDKSLSESLIQVAALGRALGSLAMPAGIIAAVPQIAALGAAAVTATGAIGLLPAVAGAAGLAVGTFAVGMSNVADALGETDTPAKLKKVNEALAALSPAARETVGAIRGLEPAWASMTRGVQESMFEGVAAKVRELGQQYIPILGDAMTSLGEDLNYTGIRLASFFQQGATANTLKQALSDSGDAVANLSDAMVPLASVFVDTFAVGAKVLADITSGTRAATTEFAAFVSKARESGDLERWIRGGLTALGQLAAIAGNVGSVLMSVFRAGGTAAGDFLGDLERGTQVIADFFASAQGQEILVAVFRTISETVSALLPGLMELGGAVLFVIGQLGQSGTFQAFAGALSDIFSAAAPLVGILGVLASTVLPPLLDALGFLAPVLVPALAGMLAVKGAMSGVEAVSSGVRTAVQGVSDGFNLVKDGASAVATGAEVVKDGFSALVDSGKDLVGQAQEIWDSVGGLSGMFQSARDSAVATGRAMASSYRSTSASVQASANRLAASAEQATRALGQRFTAGVQSGVAALRRLPASAAAAASALGGRISSAAATAAAGVRTMGTSVAAAASNLRAALPAAAASAGAALRNLPVVASSAASAAGTALRGMATSTAASATAAATSLRTFGSNAASSVRTMASQVAASARAAGTGLVTGLSSAAAAAARVPTQIASGFRTATASIGSSVAAIPGMVRTAFAGIPAAVGSAVTGLGRLAGAAAGAGAAVGAGLSRAFIGARVSIDGVTSRVGGLMGALGGPWGAALMVAGAAVAIFAGKQRDAAAKAQEHKAALDALNGTLDAFSGAITQATVNEKAKQLAQDGSLDTLRRLNVSTGDYTQASLGNEEALSRVTKQLGDQTRAGIENSNAYKGNREQLDAMGLTLDDLTLAAMGFAPAQDKVNDAVMRSSTAGPEALAQNKALARSLTDAGGEAAVMAQKLGISVDEVRKMQDATRSAATASQDFQTNLKGMSGALAGIKDGVAPTTALANGLRDLGGSAALAAQNAGEADAKLGGVEAGARSAGASMASSRKAFVEAATAALGSGEAAEALANKIGLIPSAAETNFRSNATGVAAEMNVLTAQIGKIPAGKSVQVQALTAPAQANLEALGFKVEKLPDGTFSITANTDQASANLEAFTRGAANKKAKVTIDGTTTPADQALAAVLRAIQSGKGTVQIDGNPVPVQQALAFVKGAIGQTKGDVTIGATKAPADQVLSAYISSVNSGSGTVTVNGQTFPADQALAALVQAIQTPATKPVGADTSGGQAAVTGLQGTATAPATKPIGGDNTGGLSANELLNGAVGTGATKPIGGDNSGGMGANASLNGAVGTTATKPIAGNPAGANAANAGVVGAVQTPATKPIGANDSGARGTVSSFGAWVSGLTYFVSVIANKIGFSAGGIVPMEHGGIIPNATGRIIPLAKGDAGDPMKFAGHQLSPMSARQAKIVGPNTWRVVGDRPSGDELFLPLVKSSAWSQALLEVGAQRMGRQLVPRGMTLQQGPEVAVTPMAEGGMVTAARAIVARMNARGQMFEDLTWKGAPAVVGQHNDELLNARDRAGYGRDTKRFLEDYIRRNGAVAAPKATAAPSTAQMKAQVQAAQVAKATAPSVTVQTGLDVAQLKAIHGQLIGLRADVLASGAWGPQLAENLRGWTNRVLSQIPATQRAALQRDLADIGPWG